MAKAIDYLLSPNHWPGFTGFLDDGRICLTNNCAERALRGVALGRKSWLFAGSERVGHRAALMYSLIGSAKMNGIDPQAWLADAIATHPAAEFGAIVVLDPQSGAVRAMATYPSYDPPAFNPLRDDAAEASRRTEILETANSVIASAGLRASVQQIADAAGILAGSLYHHFESKEAILIELIERYHADLDRWI